jgi:SAM-dependent methyltransferase
MTRCAVRYRVILPAVLVGLLGGCAVDRPAEQPTGQVLLVPDDGRFTQAAADRMARSAEGHLAPVYAPLAEHLVEQYGLAGRQGVGIDLGAGPGTLIVELARRTKMHWVNADVNPHFFAGFYHRADEAKVGHRVSAVFADAQALPFRCNYADIVVSRGAYQFWPDKVRAFGQVHRVLKPGGVAFIGRGLSPNLPVDVARTVRRGGSGGPPYDPDQAEAELRQIMRTLGIRDFRIIRPQPADSQGINYGIWIEWRK